MKTFPTLYKLASTGKELQWRIWVDGPTYYEEYGQSAGKLQTTPGTTCQGKNVGRTNETTPEQQAESEAQSKWEKKLSTHNYTESKTDAKAGKASNIVSGGILPMLAHKFSDHGDKLVYPCFVQPKLDGHRCICMSDGLWSRTRKPITGVPHVATAAWAMQAGPPLDGELYNHAYRAKFEELTHFIRQKDPTPGHEIVQYHVYDIAMAGTFRTRTEYLASMRACFTGPLVLVETREVANEEELMLAFEDFLAQGYEGAIARNANGFYVNKRSYDLLKIKQFDDAEYMCTGIEEGRGKLAGHGIFVCRVGNKTGPEFRAKMKGSQAELTKYFEHPDRYIGRLVTVKYQGLTKNGIPRFPVALRMRTDVV